MPVKIIQNWGDMGRMLGVGKYSSNRVLNILQSEMGLADRPIKRALQ